MIIDQVIEVAKPYLESRTIKDAVVGLALIGIELDNGNIGLSYMLRENLPSGCSSFSFAQDIIGKNALEVAKLAQSGTDDAQRGVGMAVLTAASREKNLIDIEDHDTYFGIDVQSEDTVGMIGFIGPVAKRFEKKAKKLIVFDEAITLSGQNDKEVYKMADQPKLLPECDIVILSGTTMINSTVDELLKMCCNAREIVMVGSSTPMYPEAFQDTNITVLAGSWWNHEYKEELFKIISLSGGISHIQKSMIKKAVRV